MKTHWLLTLCWCWLLAFALGNDVLAQDKQELIQPKVPLEQLLNRDGTLNLASGFHGSLDPAGWQMMTGTNGGPRFVPANAVQLTAGAAQPMAVPGDENWDNRFSGNGINLVVHDLVFDGSGNLYAGGVFTSAGGIAVSNIAKWDGTKWSALGSGIEGSANVDVRALAFDGSGSLYAAGQFTTAGGVSVNNVAKWDIESETWSAVGNLYSLQINDLAVDANGNLYAAGFFGTSIGTIGTARWDGSSWSTLDDGLGPAHAIALDGNGNLYVGGSFTAYGPTAANMVAKWDGSGWSGLGLGLSAGGGIASLAVDGSGNLYVGGRFALPGLVVANRVAKWDGSNWSTLGGPMDGPMGFDRVHTVAVDGNGNVYAGGTFHSAGGVSASQIAKWNPSTGAWAPLGAGIRGWAVLPLAFDGSGNLYAGGFFRIAGGVVANSIAKWDGTSWSALGRSGMNNGIRALAVESGGNLYAGGSFTVAGEVSANCIAKWNGTGWSALGRGTSSYVNALAADGNGNLYAGGHFMTAGEVPATNLARWDGANWSALGSGTNSYVKALALDGSGNLYVGGDFTVAGDATANHIAKWDGMRWSALGSGVNGLVNALAVDERGNIYAGGSFTIAGEATAVSNIAKWDGTNWSALGTGVSGSVLALTIAGDGNLYAAGSFTAAGGMGISHIAQWNGAIWSALGSGLEGDVYALAADGSGNLYAGGAFATAGVIVANHIAKWDGMNWSALGSGTNAVVYALAVTSREVYAGGNFTTAGGKPSSYFGRYVLNTPPTADAGADQTVITATGSTQITLNASGSSDPDGDPLTYTWRDNGKDIAGPSNSATSQVTLNVGIHTIELTVDDGRGGTDTDVVIITVKSAVNAIDDLIAMVNSLDLNNGIKTALIKQLSQARDYLQGGENQKAIDRLNIFIQLVPAQIGEPEASALIAQAQAIIAAINAASAPKVAFSATEIVTLPNSYALTQNFPNPFNPVTTIQFSVPRESHIRLKVYNAFGAEVATLVDQQVAAGTYKINWDASRLASGFYLYRLEAEGFAQTKKLLLMK